MMYALDVLDVSNILCEDVVAWVYVMSFAALYPRWLRLVVREVAKG